MSLYVYEIIVHIDPYMNIWEQTFWFGYHILTVLSNTYAWLMLKFIIYNIFWWIVFFNQQVPTKFTHAINSCRTSFHAHIYTNLSDWFSLDSPLFDDIIIYKLIWVLIVRNHKLYMVWHILPFIHFKMFFTVLEPFSLFTLVFSNSKQYYTYFEHVTTGVAVNLIYFG